MRRLSFFSIILIFSFLACSTPKEPSIGEQIRDQRIQKGLSQEQLAESVGLTQNALSLIEDGLATPIHDKIIAIEMYLEVEFEWEREKVK